MMINFKKVWQKSLQAYLCNPQKRELSSPDCYRDGSEYSDLHRKWLAGLKKIEILGV
jgi:hypothetical protein